MKLIEDLGLVPRSLYVLFGLMLGVATIASAWHDWPQVLSGKEQAFGFALMLAVALPVSCLIILWACIGRHKEWHIGDDHIHIHLLSLTSWKKAVHIRAHDIDSFGLESAAYEDSARHTAYWVTIGLKDGKTLQSPKTFDKGVAEQVQARIAALHTKGETGGDFSQSAPITP